MQCAQAAPGHVDQVCEVCALAAVHLSLPKNGKHSSLARAATCRGLPQPEGTTAAELWRLYQGGISAVLLLLAGY